MESAVARRRGRASSNLRVLTSASEWASPSAIHPHAAWDPPPSGAWASPPCREGPPSSAMRGAVERVVNQMNSKRCVSVGRDGRHDRIRRIGTRQTTHLQKRNLLHGRFGSRIPVPHGDDASMERPRLESLAAPPPIGRPRKLPHARARQRAPMSAIGKHPLARHAADRPQPPRVRRPQTGEKAGAGERRRACVRWVDGWMWVKGEFTSNLFSSLLPNCTSTKMTKRFQFHQGFGSHISDL